MTAVTFPDYAGGATYTDDADPDTGMGRGGHRTRLLPMLSATVATAEHVDATAEHVDTVAAGVLSAPGTQATSSSSLTIGLGARTLTVEPGKALVVGMPVRLATSSSAYMDGIVSAYNATTGALSVTVSAVYGSGTYSTWKVFLTGRAALPDVSGHEGERLRVVAGAAAWTPLYSAEALAGVATIDLSGGDVSLAAGAVSTQRVVVAAATDWASVRLPPSTTLPAGFEYEIINDTLRPVAVRSAAGRRVASLLPLARTTARLLDPAAGQWSAAGPCLHPCPELVVTPAAVAAVRVVPLDATRALIAWYSGATISLAVVTTAAAVATVGTVVTVATGAVSLQDVDVCALSAATACVVWAETTSGPAYRARVAPIAVAGSVVTVGAPVTAGAMATFGVVRVAALDAGRAVMIRGTYSPASLYATTIGITAGAATMYADSANVAINASLMTLTSVDSTRVLVSAGSYVLVLTCAGTAAPAAGSSVYMGTTADNAASDGAGSVLMGYAGGVRRADLAGTTVTLSAAVTQPGSDGSSVGVLTALLAAGDSAVLVTSPTGPSACARIRHSTAAPPDLLAASQIGRLTARTSRPLQDFCALSAGLLMLIAVRASDSYPVLTLIEVTP